MKKSELVSKLNIYKHRRGLRRRISPKRQIELLEDFLSQPTIQALSDEDMIDWQQFRAFVEAHKRQSETFESLFSDDYLKSKTGSADLFLKFKMNFVAERVSSFEKNELELALRDYKRGRGLRRILLPKQQIKFLEGFLSQRSIRALPGDSKISWGDFQRFVENYKRHNENFESLFSEGYLKSKTGSADLFSKFKLGEKIIDPSIQENLDEKVDLAVRQAQLAEEVCKNKVVNERIFSFLNDREVATSRYGLLLSREAYPMKKIWWDRLKHIGLSEELLERLKQTKRISNYEFLYLAYKKLSVPFRKTVTTDFWQLLVLSGEPEALQYAIDEKLVDIETKDLSVIHYAALSGRREQLKAAVSMGEELKQEDNQDENAVRVRNKLEQKDEQGRNALHFACWSGQTDVVDYCLEQGLQLKMEDGAKRTAAYYAVLSGSITQVKHIEEIRVFPSIHHQLRLNKELLSSALPLYTGSLTMVTLLMIMNPPLGIAASTGLQLLPSPLDLKDHTLIEAAIKSNDLPMIKFIGKKYSFAIRYEYQRLFQGGQGGALFQPGALFQGGANLPEFFKFLGAQIEMIAESGSLELFKLSSEPFTREQILEIRSRDNNNDESLLHLAIKSGSIELVDYLVDEFKFVMDSNCAYCAVMSGCPDMLERVAWTLKNENALYRLPGEHDIYHERTLDGWAEESPNSALIRDKIEELRGEFNKVDAVPRIGGP